MRRAAAMLFFAFLALPLVHAGDEGLAGHWKVTLIEDGNQLLFWLVHFDSKGGKLVGSADPLYDLPPTDLTDLKVTGDLVQFNLKLRKGPTFAFEGKLPRAGAKKIFGSLSRPGRMNPAVLEMTPASTVVEVHKDLLTRTPNDPRVFDSALYLIDRAKEDKAAAKDVQAWAATALRTAENFGPKLHLDVSMKLVDALLKQDGYAEAAVETARKAEQSLDPAAPIDMKIRVLTSLAKAFGQAGKSDEAKQTEKAIDKLVVKDYQEYSAKMLDFKLEKFAGRKGKSQRAVLLELFTGAQCPPCVAADLAFDGILKSYTPAEVVLLQYHLHVPRPDALTNADTEARADYYGDKKIPGTPSILFSGAAAPLGGGGKEDAVDFYQEYRKRINTLLESDAAVTLSGKAVRKGDKIKVDVKVTGLEKPSDKIRLRFVLAEEVVRYKGSNGLSYHHRVVRDLPGGLKGIGLAKKESEHSLEIDLADVAKKLNRYLDDFARTESPFPDDQRPMRLTNLSVVALVQDDTTQEVLNAVNLDVKE